MAAPPSSIGRTCGEPCATSASAGVPLGTALADLELQQEALALGADELLALPEDEIDARAVVLDRQADERAALAALIRMGRDYLRLDPVGGADTFSSWLTATVQSEGDHPGGRDAVDVATFHAAKGLEWTTVHLAGVEDGYVPIAHARTAAARAEEARLLYVAMTRAQRELRISWAERRTFGGKVVERRRSPLLDPLGAARRRPPPGRPSRDPLSPPVDDWSDGARPPARGPAGHRGPTIARRSRPCAAGGTRRPVPRASNRRPCSPTTCSTASSPRSPRDVDELGAVAGVGPILASHFGDAMLGALALAGGRDGRPMRFSIEQRFAADVDAVARAYADPALYVALVGLPKLSRPEVVGHDVEARPWCSQVRYQFGGELSSAARAVIDPERLTWVERSTHDLARRRTTFTMVPDHYGDRFRCKGSYALRGDRRRLPAPGRGRSAREGAPGRGDGRRSDRLRARGAPRRRGPGGGGVRRRRLGRLARGLAAVALLPQSTRTSTGRSR